LIVLGLAGRDVFGIVGDDAGGVSGNQGRGVGIGAIQQHLNFGGLAAGQIAREIGEHANHGVGVAVVENALYLLLAARLGHHLEAAGAFETRQQRAAFGRAVAVHPGDFGVVHVERHGVAEDDELEERRNEEQAAHARIAEQLDELFAENDANSLPHGQATF